MLHGIMYHTAAAIMAEGIGEIDGEQLQAAGVHSFQLGHPDVQEFCIALVVITGARVQASSGTQDVTHFELNFIVAKSIHVEVPYWLADRS